MVYLRSPSEPPESPEPPAADPAAAGGRCRLNLLLTTGGFPSESWGDVLPRLLEPMGVAAVRARSGREAAQVIQSTPIHIAVVDLALPLDAPDPGPRPEASLPTEEGGDRILQLLSRSQSPPPVLVVKRRRTRREENREILSALHAGAFAVIERPVHLDAVLEAMRRVLRRYYADRWPGPSAP